MNTTGLVDLVRERSPVAKVFVVLVIGVGLYWLVQWWQYPPAVQYDNLKYIQLLRTAVSSKRSDWVKKVEGVIHDRFDSGKLSERERAHFNEVIALADAEQWDAAHRMCYRFEEAQLNRRRSSPPSPELHVHSHD
ncbi:MAG: hypothetical protein DWH91_04810 [Planctomycetota bacterium]|nr:MAG: hypothetical protein DWH91_04810 [Planctomycetota bacterium]